MAISTVGWHETVLSSTVYNFKIDNSLILRQVIFDSNFSKNIHAYLDISFSRQLTLKSRTRVIYAYTSLAYYSKTDMAYN